MTTKPRKDEMRSEYDFSKGVRGKHAHRFTGDVLYIAIEPDVAAHFKDAQAVNDALRGLITAAKSVRKRPA